MARGLNRFSCFFLLVEKTARIVGRKKECYFVIIEKTDSYFFMTESKFQRDLIKELKDIFPGCIVLKNDSGYLQGIPDLTIFYNDRWAMLECKKSANSHHQPNQEYYVEKTDSMSFARFIFPENKEAVLNELKSALGAKR